MNTTYRAPIILFCLLATAALTKAQSTVYSKNFGLPWTTVSAGGQSNIAFQAASSTHTAGTAVQIKNPPNGIDITLVGSMATNATPQIGVGFQTSPNNTNWSQNLLWMIIPGNLSNPTNITRSTNFSQAVLGNSQYFRIGSTTNGPGTALTISNVIASYYY